jgi:Mannosyltransferase (PIG-V)
MAGNFFAILLSFFLAKSTLLAVVLGTTYLSTLPIPFHHSSATDNLPFGYDSSSSILLPDNPSILSRLASALFRWDSVYFISLAQRGYYLYEQEFAFGFGWPSVIRTLTPSIKP